MGGILPQVNFKIIFLPTPASPRASVEIFIYLTKDHLCCPPGASEALSNKWFAMSLTLEELRQQYTVAVASADCTVRLLHALQTPTPTTSPAEWLAYQAATEALQAKHTFNLLTKLSYAEQAKRTFEKAVAQAPDNVEVRFLRFSMQHHLPAFLEMSQNLAEDRNVIVEGLASAALPGPLRIDIVRFMLQSGRCGAEEARKLAQYLVASRVGN